LIYYLNFYNILKNMNMENFLQPNSKQENSLQNIPKERLLPELAKLMFEQANFEEFAASPFVDKETDALRIKIERLKMYKDNSAPVYAKEAQIEVPLVNLSEQGLAYFLAEADMEIPQSETYDLDDMYISWVALDKNKHEINSTVGSKEIFHK